MAVFTGAENGHVAISNVLFAAGFGAVEMIVLSRPVFLITDKAMARLHLGSELNVIVVGIATANAAVALIPNVLFKFLVALLTFPLAKVGLLPLSSVFVYPVVVGAATV